MLQMLTNYCRENVDSSNDGLPTMTVCIMRVCLYWVRKGETCLAGLGRVLFLVGGGLGHVRSVG